MKKLLIATKNPGKIAEYRIIFKDLPLEIVTLGDLNINESVEEDGKTFDDNAIKKAKFYYKLSGLPTLAEDGGIEIDYLGGEPGVKSRRWPGYEATDEELINMTYEKLKGVPLEKRGAQFRVVIALVINSEIETSGGAVQGIILEKPVKTTIPGYPFRSVFYIPAMKKVFAEMTEEEEMLVSHRKKAIERLLPIIKEYLY
jgi:XTP/dITP diphosphohydrolase